MIRYVYSFYHIGAKYYLKPEINEIVPANSVISMKRDLLKNSQVYIKNGIQDCDFCLLGTFDDESGKFEGSPQVLLSQKEITSLLASTLGNEVKNNG